MVLFLLSLLIVALGQADLVAFLAPLAALCGYALFWKTLFKMKRRFLMATLWFTGVQLIKLSWLTHTEYVGPWILAFYFIFSLFIGLQFALLSLWVRERMSLLHLLALASAWTLMEYSRTLILTGYTWNPVGLALEAFLPSLQAASLMGVYGLSFLVILTNLLFLTWRPKAAIAVAIAPYAFGLFHLLTVNQESEKMPVLLVQTGIDQEQRKQSALEQWHRVLGLIQPYWGKKIGLIVLPEGALPYPESYPVYPYADVLCLFYHFFGQEGLSLFSLEKGQENVSNAAIAQAIARLYQAELIVGFESKEEDLFHQSMFYYTPDGTGGQRYDKRALIPIGEYSPFEWCEEIAGYHGIGSFFTPGARAVLFRGKIPLGTCICYEELNGALMQENRQLGSECLVSISNDGWYPGGALAKQHYHHAKLRAVEAGTPLLRSCTTGITAALDACGRELASLPLEEPGALLVETPLFHYKTLYAKAGDLPILLLSLLFPFLFALEMVSFQIQRATKYQSQ